MRKWQSYYDVLYFPLVLLFVASVLKGISGLILTPEFQMMFNIKNEWVILFAEMFRYTGYYLSQFFPFLFLLKVLSRKYEDSVPVFIGTVSYLLIVIATMFFSKANLPSFAYSPELGVMVNAAGLSLEGNGYRYPLAMGMIPIFFSAILTRRFYASSRRRGTVGTFSFINRDAHALLTTGLASLAIGIALAYAWPYVIKGMMWLFNFIGSDLSNPINLFIYGILERVMAVLDLDSILHTQFWFSELGGSWINNGTIYYGDVAIWTAQQAAGVYNTGFGRLLTPYYVQNLFIVPAIIIGTFRTFTDKIERNKYIIFLIAAIIVSMLCGNILPIEIYMLIMTPLYYFFHLFMTGVLYAVLQAMHIWFGYTYASTSVTLATPGSLFNLLNSMRNIDNLTAIRNIAIVGVAFAVVYYIILYFYYNRYCLDLLDVGFKDEYVDNFIHAVGGLDNIKKIYSTPTKVILQPEDSGLLNFKQMQQQGVYKVVETRTTYDLSYGAISYLLVKEVEKRLNPNSRD